MKPLLAAALGLTTMASARAQEPANTKHILVAYYSWGGNTQSVANHIQALTGGDMLEIKLATVYPTDYDECAAQAKMEQAANARPALAESMPADLNGYDIVFVGYPNWWGSMPMFIHTFLEKYDWKGKTLIPFATHGGGGRQRCFSDFGNALKDRGATVKEGFITAGSNAMECAPQVLSWIEGMGYRLQEEE